jgi:hypothetical protein
MISVSLGFAQTRTGAIGDSLLDEHFDQAGFSRSLAYSKNGFELMAASGKIDPGPIGNWGGTRGSGFEYNWASAGATTSSLVANGQHTNLASQVGPAGIVNAIMIIGSNDLFPFQPTGTFSSPYEAIYEGVATPAQINAFASLAVANVVQAATALKNSGAHVIVATPADYGIAPLTKILYPDPFKRERVDAVIEAWGAEAKLQLTQDLLIPVVDVYRLTKDIWGDNASQNPNFTLGGVTLNLNGTGGVQFTDVLSGNPISPTSDTADAFVHDGIHPNNVIGGVFANLFMTAFNSEYGQSFELFSEQQILQNAGPNLGAQYSSDTLIASLGGRTYSDYVVSAIPEPSAAMLVSAIGIRSCFHRNRRKKRKALKIC